MSLDQPSRRVESGHQLDARVLHLAPDHFHRSGRRSNMQNTTDEGEISRGGPGGIQKSLAIDAANGPKGSTVRAGASPPCRVGAIQI